MSSLHIPPKLEETGGLDPWPASPRELPAGPPRIPIKGSTTNDASFLASGSENKMESEKWFVDSINKVEKKINTYIF